EAADLAIQAGSRLSTDSASSYRALKGYAHDFVNHTRKEYARGDVHENRAECLVSLLKPYLRVFRGISKLNLPGHVGFFQFLRNFRQLNAFEQAELILQAALDPAIPRRAKNGEVFKWFDPLKLLQTGRNWGTCLYTGRSVLGSAQCHVACHLSCPLVTESLDGVESFATCGGQPADAPVGEAPMVAFAGG